MDTRASLACRWCPVIVALALVVAACGAEDGGSSSPSTTTTTISSTTTTTTPATTTTTTSTTMPVPTTVAPAPSLYDVVLVAADDTLNVRTAPGANSPKLTVFLPDQRGVVATGPTEEVGDDIWREVETEDARGWVNGFFLTPQVAAADFAAAEDDLRAVLDQFVAIVQAGGDLGPVVSGRGLHVVHFDPPRRFEPEKLAMLLGDPTVLGWGSGGCGPEPCVQETFKQAVADSIVSTYVDPDVQIAVDEVIPGPNGMQPEYIVPFEFGNFHYLAIHDPGDNPDYGGLDWMTWNVYFEREASGWKIAALSVDEWAP